jgi:hypothetical protein
MFHSALRRPTAVRRFIRLMLFCGLALLFLTTWSSDANATVCGPGQVCFGVSKTKGFDKCTAPPADKMQTWWDYSPYWDTSIYLGGSTRACTQPNLTANWVNTVHNQGWNFYLIWAGPQAPCSSSPSKISYNTTTAFNQGKQEALAASSAAINLYIHGRDMFYYDMENYDQTNVSCRNAVNSFVSGWVYELRVQMTERAGVYGSGCNAKYWTTIDNVPDDVWIADWTNDPDVWGLYCLGNGVWNHHQRLHQYQRSPFTESHYETYGSVRFFVDNDCADGLVTPGEHGYEDTACTQE